MNVTEIQGMINAVIGQAVEAVERRETEIELLKSRDSDAVAALRELLPHVPGHDDLYGNLSFDAGEGSDRAAAILLARSVLGIES